MQIWMKNFAIKCIVSFVNSLALRCIFKAEIELKHIFERKYIILKKNNRRSEAKSKPIICK